MNAEFTKARLRRGFASVEKLRAHVDAGDGWDEEFNGQTGSSETGRDGARRVWSHPRWVRINTIKTSLNEQIQTTFEDYNAVDSLEQLSHRQLNPNGRVICVDKHVPNLVAVPSSIDLSKDPAYLNGLIILQDKASCFPAYLLDPRPEDGDIIDACAAPGNKTTHLAALLHNHKQAPTTEIYACERELTRAMTLQDMVQRAGADNHVNIQKGHDFLRIDPHKAPWSLVGAVLLDPSCSGSGIVGRDEVHRVVLPSMDTSETPKQSSKKRKRKAAKLPSPSVGNPQETLEEVPLQEVKLSQELSTRLQALSSFQLRLLLHAFEFPSAHKITYSTCSIFAEENEEVVFKALDSDVVKRKGWRILLRHEQVAGMRSWKIRGNPQDCKDAASVMYNIDDVAEACIRCEKGTQEGTQGFFVAAFVRDRPIRIQEGAKEEGWEGFSDGDDDVA